MCDNDHLCRSEIDNDPDLEDEDDWEDDEYDHDDNWDDICHPSEPPNPR